MMLKKLFRPVFLVVMFALLYLPLIVVMLYSFNSNKYSIVWKVTTLKWFEALFKNTQLVKAAVNSLEIGVIAASIATIFGTFIAYTLYRYKFKTRKIIHSSMLFLTVAPDIVLGVSFLILFVALSLPLGFITLLLAHVTLCLPFIVFTVLARLKNFNTSIIEASKDLGASEATAFVHIVLPNIIPAIVSGWLLAFTISLDDVLVSFFVTGPSYEVLPLAIYSMVRVGVKPEVNALSAVLFVCTFTLVSAAYFINKLRKN